MNRNILLIAFLLISCCALGQNDSVFVLNQTKPVTGDVLIRYKKNDVSVKSIHGKTIKVGFDQIISIKSAAGISYVRNDINNEPVLLILIVHGKYSLLYQEDTKTFYIEKQDSLKSISKPYMERALPLIFGEELMDQFYKKANVRPEYSFKYLKKLTSFANAHDGSQQLLMETNSSQFKTTVSIGLYAGVGLNRTAFDLTSEDPRTNRLVYTKTKYYQSHSVPIGISSKINLFPRFGIDFQLYYAQTAIKTAFADEGSYYKLVFPPSVLTPEKFDPKLIIGGYSFRVFNFDLSANYALARRKMTRLRPYLFAGPSIAVMRRNELKVSARYFNNPDAASLISRWSESNTNEYMVGVNAGAGISYAAGRRILLSLSGKFMAGVFPKVSQLRTQFKEQNDTPVNSSTFGYFVSSFDSRYNQYYRSVLVGGSILFKL